MGTADTHPVLYTAVFRTTQELQAQRPPLLQWLCKVRSRSSSLDTIRYGIRDVKARQMLTEAAKPRPSAKLGSLEHP